MSTDAELIRPPGRVRKGSARGGSRGGSHFHKSRTKHAPTPRVAMATRRLCGPVLAGLGVRAACWESTSPRPVRRFELGGPDVGRGAMENSFPLFGNPVPGRRQGQVSAVLWFLLRPHGGRPRAGAGGGVLAISAAELQQFHHVAVVSSPPPELPVWRRRRWRGSWGRRGPRCPGPRGQGGEPERNGVTGVRQVNPRPPADTASLKIP